MSAVETRVMISPPSWMRASAAPTAGRCRRPRYVVAIEKDLAIIDIGLKTEGRVALREFAGPGRENPIKVGDEVEVYLERVENAMGEAVLSRDKARREESWVKLEKAFNAGEKVSGVIFNQVKGGFTVDLDGAVAFCRARRWTSVRSATSLR